MTHVHHISAADFAALETAVNQWLETHPDAAILQLLYISDTQAVIWHASNE